MQFIYHHRRIKARLVTICIIILYPINKQGSLRRLGHTCTVLKRSASAIGTNSSQRHDQKARDSAKINSSRDSSKQTDKNPHGYGKMLYRIQILKLEYIHNLFYITCRNLKILQNIANCM